ncbi:hypothetical protein [Gracilibacillus saliphilus]|uniref:hypothetical protein n=1 Tax=Gracilibacillus saliphilus TaxID=543890 RepID=UPI0013D47F9B|nr:hypothetical protein [Gracilibacillus saliphilus]
MNAIAVPAIGSIIDRAEEGAQEAEAELIENAARLALIAVQVDGEESNWVFNGGDQPNITVQELLDNGYLETDVRQVVLLRMLMELLLPLYMTNRL